MATGETRGVSDSSAALVASSINGGGCLPPPTPKEKIAEALGKHMVRAVQPKETNYRDALPESLAWRTTTQTMMVGGLAGEVTEEELANIPLDLTSGPFCQKVLAGRLGPVERPSRRRLEAVACYYLAETAIRSLSSRPGRHSEEGATRAAQRAAEARRHTQLNVGAPQLAPPASWGWYGWLWLRTPEDRPHRSGPNGRLRQCTGLGQRCRFLRLSNPGDLLMWETSAMSANVTVFGEERAYR